MKFKPALAAVAAAAATAAAVAGAAVASAEAEVKYLGQPGELVNGDVVQHWTVTDLKPSTDVIPYQPVGTLWEATATDEAIAGNVTPIVPNLNARAENGDTYRVLFGVATEQGVNPSTLAQGEKTTGKIYFDVTGEAPDSVFYSDGGPNVVLWLETPAPATGSAGADGASSYGSGTSPSTSGAAETTPTPAADPAAETTVPAEPAPGAVPAGGSGTPLPEGSSGTPLPEGSSGTPLPAGAVPAEPEPAAVPAAVAPVPHGSAGTPIEEALPAAVPANPTTTVPVPAPPA
ncbi:DUF1942 domain-containing protein [Mycobacterium sp. ITM-2016-00317]|uniref:MPT63 family protein n=1 Tax=Mycobacterium sp. ITM-2016-00317 TaxID=2099694 RepID=UPI00287FC043|nr:DUF1942 domain-containing protein [Mycobacterium sp. ITM-2016-00317]WNG86958.1 DUF1942 domain-containing protein [Mycobacterium sp. ITM-2016-00317]